MLRRRCLTRMPASRSSGRGVADRDDPPRRIGLQLRAQRRRRRPERRRRIDRQAEGLQRFRQRGAECVAAVVRRHRPRQAPDTLSSRGRHIGHGRCRSSATVSPSARESDTALMRDSSSSRAGSESATGRRRCGPRRRRCERRRRAASCRRGATAGPHLDHQAAVPAANRLVGCDRRSARRAACRSASPRRRRDDRVPGVDAFAQAPAQAVDGVDDGGQGHRPAPIEAQRSGPPAAPVVAQRVAADRQRGGVDSSLKAGAASASPTGRAPRAADRNGSNSRPRTTSCRSGEAPNTHRPSPVSSMRSPARDSPRRARQSARGERSPSDGESSGSR